VTLKREEITVEEIPADEMVEVDDRRFILLTFERVWPKYVVSWSVRQREGEGDFPVASGSAEELPSNDAAADTMWSRVREQALSQANHAVGQATPVEQRKGFFARLFGR
jgi:hypothetical protein